MPDTLFIATSNPGKLREITAVLCDLPLHFKSLKDYPELSDAIEDADTFMGNAEKKARHFAELTGWPTLADDSGLEVDCLEGQPGVHSARFAGGHGDDRANNTKLIELLRGVPQAERTARFRCAVVIADRARGAKKRGREPVVRSTLRAFQAEGSCPLFPPCAGILASAEGRIEGIIIDDPRGHNGFGYDPHFLVPQLGKTTAELAPAHKNRISHRGQALRLIRDALREVLAR